MTVRARYDDNSRAVDRKVRKATKEWREEVAVMAALEMLRYVPVDTGELRNSFRVKGDKVENIAEYAAAIEFGTSKTEAQPSMRRPVHDRSFHRRALARW